jgi:hypothetical protein
LQFDSVLLSFFVFSCFLCLSFTSFADGTPFTSRKRSHEKYQKHKK